MTLRAWGETAGTAVVWAVWRLGTLGLLRTCGFVTLLYLRFRRALLH